VLDCGDFVSGSGEINELKTKYVLQAMSMIKYDAINLGERDFMFGPQLLSTLQKEYNLPFVAANIYQIDLENRFTNPYIIKELEGKKVGDAKINPIKVGIFGILLNRSTLVYRDYLPKLTTKNPIQIAEEIVKELEKKCDIVIALAHLTTPEIEELATKVNGIDVIIGGHDFYKKSTPYEVNGAIILLTGAKGQYVGDLKIYLDLKKNIISYDGQVVELGAQFPEDPAFQEIDANYEKAYTQMMEEKYKQSEH